MNGTQIILQLSYLKDIAILKTSSYIPKGLYGHLKWRSKLPLIFNFGFKRRIEIFIGYLPVVNPPRTYASYIVKENHIGTHIQTQKSASCYF